MYHSVKVEALSKNQLSKLLRGQPVRVKHNPKGPVDLKLSVEQAKKVAKAYKKGSACNITLDPYQVDSHQSLKGSGLFSKAKAAAKVGLSKAKVEAMKRGKEASRVALQKGQAYLVDEALPQLDRQVRIGAKKFERDNLRDEDEEYFDAPFQDYDTIDGEGIGRFFKKVKKGLKPVVKLAKPVVSGVYKVAKPVVSEAIKKAQEEAIKAIVTGGGRGRGRPRKHGGALMPAGY